jgi:hypothetical protein
MSDIAKLHLYGECFINDAGPFRIKHATLTTDSWEYENGVKTKHQPARLVVNFNDDVCLDVIRAKIRIVTENHEYTFYVCDFIGQEELGEHTFAVKKVFGTYGKAVLNMGYSYE